jgi:hydroxymethylglutaryl-CoA lyase
MPSSTLPPRVYLQEVAVRDGFQIEPAFVATEDKIALIDDLSTTGLAKIEITSFVSPKAIPNLRDAQEVALGITRVPGVTYVALVPNQRGAERALECGLDEINLVLSASATHNLANMRMTPAQSLAGFRSIMEMARGTGLKINGTIATAFGCPFEGPLASADIVALGHAFRELGMHSVTLADTTGMADPRQVAALTAMFLDTFPGMPLTLHFHNTRGMGLANVMAAIDAGAVRFDGALGGLGGCPFAPGATGNVCTEDVAHMLDSCGIATGVDLDALLRIARGLPELLGHEVPGQLIKAGRRSERYQPPLAARCA